MQIDDIINAVRQGETSRFAEVVRIYQTAVWRVAAAMLGSVHETEEIVQQTFVQAFLRLDQFRSGEDFGVWVKQIARNQVRQQFRSDSRHAKRLHAFRDLVLADLDDPKAAIAEQPFLDALAECRESLSEKQSRLLDLRYREGLSFAEIASRMESSADAVRRMASRIRMMLRMCTETRVAEG